MIFGLRWQSAATTRLWVARSAGPLERSTTFESGVALRFPPQSKTARFHFASVFIRVHPWLNDRYLKLYETNFHTHFCDARVGRVQFPSRRGAADQRRPPQRIPVAKPRARAVARPRRRHRR